MTATSETRARTAQGIFLGAAVGDALGWPQEIRGGLVGGQKVRDAAKPQLEFRGWTRYAGHYSGRYRDPVGPGEYSDDTQLLLATARSCLAGPRWWEHLTEVELPTWPVYQRGGGGAVLTAAGSWADGRPPWSGEGGARAQAVEKRYRGAGANGVAMRIAPHILWADGPGDLVRRVVRDGIATHGHPRALVGALVYAFALAQAASSRTMHGFGDSVGAAAAGLVDIDQILPELPPGWGTNQVLDALVVAWRQATRETSQLLALVADSLNRGAMSNPDETLERIGCADPKINGAGTVSAAAAIYLASRFAARPQDGLLSAAFLRKADTDTLASLTAAIIGALHDTRWLGNLAASVQDADYITRLAERSAARATEPTWPTTRPLTLRRQLTSALLRDREASGEFPDGRQYRLIDMAPLSDGRVLRARLRLSDGQTVLADLRADPPAGPDGDGRERPGRQSHPGEPEPARPRSEHGAPSASGLSAAPAARALPMAAPQLSGPEVGVILATCNLAESAAFYARLTGRNVPVRADTAEIAPGVLLLRSSADAPIAALSAVVQITTEDLPAAARRLGLEASTEGGHTGTIEVRDPDGRTVLVSQRPASSRPDR